MNIYKKSSSLIDSLLELERKSVGIKFLHGKQDFIDYPAKETNVNMVYCTLVRNASRGDVIKVSGDKFACTGSARSLGVIKENKEEVSGVRRLNYGGYKSLCISRSVSKSAIYCEHEIYGLAIAPLEKFKVNPDIVILVTTPYNVMRLVQGYAYHFGRINNIQLLGLGAICKECTSVPFELNQMHVSMLCPGTRLVCQWKEEEMGVGIPYHMFEQVVDGVSKTVNLFERNKKKKVIEHKLEINNFKDLIDIKYNENYDNNGYIGLKEEDIKIWEKNFDR